MIQHLDIDQRELALKQQLSDLALTNREQFRTQATATYRHFSRRDRKQVHSIESREVTAYDILGAWQDQLQPLQKQLQSKRTDQTFRVTIKKQLILGASELDAKINELIDSRIVEVRTAFLNQFYATDSKQWYSLQQLIQQSDQELQDLLSRLTEYSLYTIVARENTITIIDPNSHLFTRLGQGRRVRHERKKTSRQRQERLAYIDQREKELLRSNGGILAAIMKKEWDLVTIISMRNQYDKRIGAMAKKDRSSALKRLAVFEKVTQQFRNDYIEQATSAKMSLELTRQLSEEVDALLLRIFDLSTVQKNQLLVQSKEYRELIVESKNIVTNNTI